MSFEQLAGPELSFHSRNRIGFSVILRAARICTVSLLMLPLLSILPVNAQSGSDVTPKAGEETSAPASQKGPLANGENLDAQRQLGERLITGWEIEPNRKEGLRLLEAAIEKGDLKSRIVLGRLLMDGQFLKRDRRRALDLFQSAAQMGDFEGVESMGEHLMWNGQTPDDAREAERLLSMAGASGRGSAWTTLAYGAIYGKLSKAASAKYATFVQKGRALGNTQIEIVEAERLLYGLGTKRNPARAVSNLETAASNGNPDAIKYLVRLVRDGNGVNIERSVAKARAYLKTYGAKLSPEMQQQQRFLLQTATTYRLVDFADLSRAARARSDFASPDFQRQIFQANSNFSVYLAQESLKQRSLYRGPLNGKATKSTIASFQSACKSLIWKADCNKKILSEGAVAMIILY